MKLTPGLRTTLNITLAFDQPATSSEIATLTGLTPKTTSGHLRALLLLGLIARWAHPQPRGGVYYRYGPKTLLENKPGTKSAPMPPGMDVFKKIDERFGGYDRAKLDMDAPVYAFFGDMLEAFEGE